VAHGFDAAGIGLVGAGNPRQGIGAAAAKLLVALGQRFERVWA
jgi:hypothetical protein